MSVNDERSVKMNWKIIMQEVFSVMWGLMIGFADSWEKCPVEPDNVERFCCSQLCQSEIRGLGACMCGLFVRGKND